MTVPKFITDPDIIIVPSPILTLEDTTASLEIILAHLIFLITLVILLTVSSIFLFYTIAANPKIFFLIFDFEKFFKLPKYFIL